MKLDLGIASVELPNDNPIIPTMICGLGLEDKGEDLSIGPTMAKSSDTKSFRRALSVTFSPAPDGDPTDSLAKGLNNIVARAGAKVEQVDDTEIGGSPAKVVEMTHPGPNGMVLRTMAAVVVSNNFMQSFILTSLKTKKNEKAVRAQFKTMLDTIKPGSFFDK